MYRIILSIRHKNCLKMRVFLAEPAHRCGMQISDETIDLVKKFYQTDELSRILPGMKDVVSIGGNIYERKCLILCNLSELYSNFKLEYPDLKIISKFCSLRPKWCVLAGASGTHLICVCTIHQNVILLIHGAGIEEDYRKLISYTVCEGAGKDCDYDDEDPIEYNQWVSTDRTELIKCSSSVSEFIHKLVEKLDKLIPHSYIAKSQASFKKNLKEMAFLNTAVVSMEFSENYAFTIQEEVQGYHWTSDSCTIHPVMIHCKDEKVILPLCVISEDLKHDVNMIYEIQRIVITFLKEKHPHISSIHYFSDGCAGQYKNKYNFRNLSLHDKDFQLKVQWSFFATSCGKTECDGIGGTVKRISRKESLQRPLDRQIITAYELFTFCKLNIKNINFWFVYKEEVDSTRVTLRNHYNDVKNLPRTRLFHNFKPLDDLGTIKARRTSRDVKSAPKFNLCNQLQSLFINFEQLYPGCFIACLYDNLWYFGILNEINAEEDITVKFLHPSRPSPSFFWPSREDTCAVPIPHVIAIVEPPKTMTGRIYNFSEECMIHVQSCFQKFLTLDH